MLQGRSYVPLLHARLAEIRALQELPNATKNIIFPVIRARPWLNAKSLDAVWKRIDDAFPARNFGLDLDVTKSFSNKTSEAYNEFRKLFNPEDSYSAYYGLLQKIPAAIPVLRGFEQGFPHIEGQIAYVSELDRGLVVRIDPKQNIDVTAALVSIANKLNENVVIVIDCGWGRDILLQAAKCVALLKKFVEVSLEFEFVVSGSSFPDKFSDQGERINIPMIERTLYSEVRRNYNQSEVVYGDWGSTRPPSDPVPMKNVPRIDFPLLNNWIAHRSDGSEDYIALAEHVVKDPAWTGGTGMWGEYMIESTAAGHEPALRSPAMAAAVRVNLHLHLQAHRDDPAGLVVGDEPLEEI